MNNLKVILFFIFALLALSSVDAMVIKKKIESKSDFVILGKFCYSTVPGSILIWEANNVTTNPNVTIQLYDDDINSWGAATASGNSCIDKAGFSLDDWQANKARKVVYPKDTQRPHFWYVVATNCAENGQVGTVDFTLTFLNGGSGWNTQFSYEEQGLEALYLVYFFVFLGLFGYTVFTTYKLHKNNSLHPMIMILGAVVTLEFLSVFVLLCQYGSYSHNGVGGKGAEGFGQLLDLAAQLAFILLLILISKGWAISRVTIDEKRIVFAVIGVLSFLYLFMFIWYKAGEGIASTTYMYDTAPGIVLLVARGLAMIWFMWCGYSTYMEETHPAKRNFYTLFGISFVIWFLILPMISVIAAAVEPWVRERIVTSFYVTANAIGFVAVTYLLSPSRSGDLIAPATKTSAEEYTSIPSGGDSSYTF
ncbi:hypothetical protein DICPUDRAFT_34248 [Dictyostelium purpureum]|uniref:GPR180/TMEM145 transmembrane domain-containing protein n=1 Tax=Dictyostelium purpureum TaxID=5786 RepID=F0ZMA3_DICPU|nr:uncharacterized protein DICPUDRAFT_34248 [Dictyostelium purpureum]EGC34910.1 hypothetical protein DICPUDRAFT_34248 [Dictyostelium purpureum]|eukprot:XP_003288543.1 hypothetical protein DICPUDRAFT_34248 [Dictyostelium purpureum]